MSWWLKQRGLFRALVGQTVLRWSGQEMAFFEEGPPDSPGPVFRHPNVDCLQLSTLEVRLGGGEVLQVCTTQDNDTWGLCINEHPLGVSFPESDEGSIYQEADVASLPLGVITSIRIEPNASAPLLDVELVIKAEQLVLLRAAEFYEDSYSSGRWVIGDESVMLFRSRNEREAIDWIGGGT